MSFPSNFSEITVEYLNKVLEPIFNSKIISFTQGSPIEPGFTGEIIRIIPEYENKSENNLPKCFIIKFQTSNKGINKFMTKIKGYEKEQKIYEILKPYEKELNLIILIIIIILIILIIILISIIKIHSKKRKKNFQNK